MAQEVKKRRKIFKCPKCNETIHFIVEQPQNIDRFPFCVEYKHGDHVLKIFFDKDLMIREIL
jgi:hypothetical protein